MKLHTILTIAALTAPMASFASTHSCNFQVYLADTSTGKSNVRNAPNGDVIITLTNRAPAPTATPLANGQPAPAPTLAPVVTKRLTVVGQEGEWLQISKDVEDTSAAGHSSLPRFKNPKLDLAYVHKSIIAVRSKESAVGIPVYIEPNNRDANIRTAIGLLAQNTEIKISGCAGEYAQVAASNGAIGYVDSSFLSADKVATSDDNAQPGNNGNSVRGLFQSLKAFPGELPSEVN